MKRLLAVAAVLILSIVIYPSSAGHHHHPAPLPTENADTGSSGGGSNFFRNLGKAAAVVGVGCAVCYYGFDGCGNFCRPDEKPSVADASPERMTPEPVKNEFTGGTVKTTVTGEAR